MISWNLTTPHFVIFGRWTKRPNITNCSTKKTVWTPRNFLRKLPGKRIISWYHSPTTDLSHNEEYTRPARIVISQAKEQKELTPDWYLSPTHWHKLYLVKCVISPSLRLCGICVTYHNKYHYHKIPSRLSQITDLVLQHYMAKVCIVEMFVTPDASLQWRHNVVKP